MPSPGSSIDTAQGNEDPTPFGLNAVTQVIPLDTRGARDKVIVRNIIRDDSLIEDSMKSYIINVLMEIPDLPDPGRLYRTIIKTYEIHQTASRFPKLLVKGCDFIRNSGCGRRSGSSDHSLESVASDDNWSHTVPTGPLASRLWNYTTNLGRRQGGSTLCCEITGDNDSPRLEGAHIFPFSIGALNEKAWSLWELMACFWDPRIVDSIMAKIANVLNPDGTCDRGMTGINSYENGILMTEDCHKRFDDLEFYLEPILSTITETGYTAVFNWHIPRPRSAPPYYLEPPFFDPAGDPCWRGIKTGDFIYFSTHDPNAYPLPDPSLLWARAVLTKVSRIRASGEQNMKPYTDWDTVDLVQSGSRYLGFKPYLHTIEKKNCSVHSDMSSERDSVHRPAPPGLHLPWTPKEDLRGQRVWDPASGRLLQVLSDPDDYGVQGGKERVGEWLKGVDSHLGGKILHDSGEQGACKDDQGINK